MELDRRFVELAVGGGGALALERTLRDPWPVGSCGAAWCRSSATSRVRNAGRRPAVAKQHRLLHRLKRYFAEVVDLDARTLVISSNFKNGKTMSSTPEALACGHIHVSDGHLQLNVVSFGGKLMSLWTCCVRVVKQASTAVGRPSVQMGLVKCALQKRLLRAEETAGRRISSPSCSRISRPRACVPKVRPSPRLGAMPPKPIRRRTPPVATEAAPR